MIRVSIILPNRNHATELKTSLAAIAAQTRVPDEVIVIEDASTDDSMAVIESFRPRIENLKILRNETQLGVPRAVQRGIEAATSDYIFLASADDKLEPNACATLTDTAAAFPDARLIVSQFTEWRPDLQSVTVHAGDSDRAMWYVEGDTPIYITPERFRCLLQQRFVMLAANTALIRRDALMEVGGFDPKLEWHSDWFALYAIAFRYGFCAVPRSLARFRVAPGSYSERGMRNARAQRHIALEIQRKLRSPAFQDVDSKVMAAPIVMSTFLRALLLALCVRPLWYGRLARLLGWWFGQVLQGRRPAALRRLLSRNDAPSQPVNDRSKLEDSA